MRYLDHPMEFTFGDPNIEDGYYAVPADFDDWADAAASQPKLRVEDLEDGDTERSMPDGFVFLHEDYEDAVRILALRLELDEWDGGMEVDYPRRSPRVEVSFGFREFLVLTDSEADEVFAEHVRSTLDECYDIPDSIRPFFDEQKYIDHVQASDGRGALASYDGNEREQRVGDEWYFIYRLR